MIQIVKAKPIWALFLVSILLLMIEAANVQAQSSGAGNFNINSSSIAQRRAGSATDANNLARNNPGFDPCLSPTGINSGPKCDGATSGSEIPLLSARNVGGATNDDNNRQGGFFHSTTFGAVTDNMFGAVSKTCGNDHICGNVDDDPTLCGDPAFDTGVTTGQNCGNLRFNPVFQEMQIPKGSNNLHTERFPSRRFFSLELISEDKDFNGDGIADIDSFGNPKGTPVGKTADRTAFCGDVNLDPQAVTPCQGAIVFPGFGTGFSSDFTFRRPPSSGTSNCGKDPRTAVVQTTTDLTCSVFSVIMETQLETGFPDQHTEIGTFFHLTNPDCVGSSTGAGGNSDCAAITVAPGSGNPLALTNSHTPQAYRGGSSDPSMISVNWAQHITDPDVSGIIDPNQIASFDTTMAGTFTICNPAVWANCNQSFPKVNAPTGESQTRGDPDFFVGINPN